uniref:NADH-ubiquinone oxidoreductase chain 6 n=1 Tax=Aulostomus chinensis TaxID=150448 RepID=A7E1M7_AULCH|nr:NADH dehydrogenase subunit 6 [Aulostomus chinensis]BAF74921.1 ND6 [Aulostomus chinensis]BBU25705.1 NADH dehydrogenase subunit 6 [Aulostomus chinensis]
MSYTLHMLLFGLVAGMVAVASNPSPYFAALGLVVVAGAGSGVLAGHGGSFLSLTLFLIYLGGMLVVFAYSAALAAEPYPESWGSGYVAMYLGLYVAGVVLGGGVLCGGWYEGSWIPVEEQMDFSVFQGDAGGVALMYSFGGGGLVIGGWALLVALFVALELTRGLSRGAVRMV